MQQNLAYHVPTRATGRAGRQLVRNLIHEEMNSRDDNNRDSLQRLSDGLQRLGSNIDISE